MQSFTEFCHRLDEFMLGKLGNQTFEPEGWNPNKPFNPQQPQSQQFNQQLKQQPQQPQQNTQQLKQQPKQNTQKVQKPIFINDAQKQAYLNFAKKLNIDPNNPTFIDPNNSNP